MLSLSAVSERRISNKLLNSFSQLRNVAVEKSKVVKQENQIKRAGLFAEFASPQLLPSLGQELTQDIRYNFDKLIEEAKELSATGKLPEKQIQELREFVFSNRVFLGTTRDHDRARLEFEINKKDIIKDWEQKYMVTWPKYKHNVYCDGEISIKAGKQVSRHHFIPVRSIIIKDTPDNSKMLEKGIIDPSKQQMFEHYPINASWNMVPSEAPGNHTDKLHGDESIFSSIFGPIKQDYHYDQIDDNEFTSVVPEYYKEHNIPLYVKEYDFYLDKIEEKTGFTMTEKQKQIATEFLKDYANEFPNNKELKELRYSEQGRYIFNKLIRKFEPTIQKGRKNPIKSFLMKKWEQETGNVWPKLKDGHLAKPAFIIPPYFKISQPEWWLYHPDMSDVSKEVKNSRPNRTKR